MFKVFFIALLGVCLASAVPSPGLLPRDLSIIGGVEAPEGQAPYMVSLRYVPGNFHICGGSVLDSKWVLTAAHCTRGKSHKNFRVVVGTNSLTTGGDSYSVERKIEHENYDSNNLSNDIGLLIVSKEIQFSAKVQPIKLPDEDTKSGADLVLTGWGYISGDSGSPLVESGRVVGVVSWGKPCALGHPDVYTRVYSFKTWIKKQTGLGDNDESQ